MELRLTSLRKVVSGYSSLLHSFRWRIEWTGFHPKVFLPGEGGKFEFPIWKKKGKKKTDYSIFQQTLFPKRWDESFTCLKRTYEQTKCLIFSRMKTFRACFGPSVAWNLNKTSATDFAAQTSSFMWKKSLNWQFHVTKPELLTPPPSLSPGVIPVSYQSIRTTIAFVLDLFLRCPGCLLLTFPA